MLLACETAEEGAQNNNGKTFIFCCAITQHTKQFNYPVFYCFTQAMLVLVIGMFGVQLQINHESLPK